MIQLARLPRADLLALRTRIDLLVDQPKKEEDDSDRLYPVFLATKTVFCSLGLRPPLWGVVMKGPHWCRGAEAVMGFIECHGPRLQRVEQQWAAQMAVGFAVERMKRLGIPVSLKSLGQHLEKVDELFDRKFPGYAASGLFAVIVRGF